MVSRYKTLIQKKADLSREARALLDKTEPAAEETARIDAILQELEEINADLSREERLQTAERQLAGGQGLGRVPAQAADPDDFQTFGEFLAAVAAAGSPGGRVDSRLFRPTAGPTGGSSGIPGEGGFLIRPTWSDMLLRRGRELSKLLPRASTIPIGENSDSFEAPYLQMTDRSQASTRFGGVQVYRRAEADAVTATKIDAFKKFELRLEDMMGLGYVTERLLQDAIALQAWLEDAFASAMAFKVDDELIRGTGSGQCLGVLNAPCLVTVAKEAGQAADTVVSQNVIKMFSRLHPRNMGGARWYINAGILPQLMTMYVAAGTGGQLVYTPPGGLSDAPYGALLGRPVEALEHCSALGDVGDILFADFGDYLVIEKSGLQVADSMHVRFIYAERTFRFVYRMNGQPKEPAAVTPYKGSDTLSAFVTLAAR